jgi:catechol 2,3-dioxygenase-like lactoylglutathione lyase family enzyme
MSADEFGRSLPKFSANLLVRNVETSLQFYREVLGATVCYSDNDFAALSLLGVDFMLHADHTYDHHPLYPHLIAAPVRGAGAELRFLGIDPDKVEEAPNESAHRSCSRRRISATGGAKSPSWTRTATSGPWAFQYRHKCNRG